MMSATPGARRTPGAAMGLLGFKVLVFSFVCAVCHPLIPTILKDCQPRLHGREVAPRLCPVQEWAASIPGTHSGASAADGPAGAGYDSLQCIRR